MLMISAKAERRSTVSTVYDLKGGVYNEPRKAVSVSLARDFRIEIIELHVICSCGEKEDDKALCEHEAEMRQSTVLLTGLHRLLLVSQHPKSNENEEMIAVQVGTRDLRTRIRWFRVVSP